LEDAITCGVVMAGARTRIKETPGTRTAEPREEEERADGGGGGCEVSLRGELSVGRVPR
jgi:hypothetical protein